MAAGDIRDVCDFGATGNGRHRDTDAIQAALDDCADCSGTVIVPPGTYLTGPHAVGGDEVGVRELVQAIGDVRCGEGGACHGRWPVGREARRSGFNEPLQSLSFD